MGSPSEPTTIYIEQATAKPVQHTIGAVDRMWEAVVATMTALHALLLAAEAVAGVAPEVGVEIAEWVVELVASYWIEEAALVEEFGEALYWVKEAAVVDILRKVVS